MPTGTRGIQPFHLPLLVLAVVVVVTIPLILLENPSDPIQPIIAVASNGPIAVVCGMAYFVGRVRYPRQIAVGAGGLTIWNFGRPKTIGWQYLLPPIASSGAWNWIGTTRDAPGYRGLRIPLTSEQAQTVLAAPYHPNWDDPELVARSRGSPAG